MLKFVLTLALIGAVIGLLFSRDGKEGEDTLRGAKKGLKLGCIVILLVFILFVGLVLLAGLGA